MKTILLYKSKYGSTKQYAQWLAEKLDCDIAETGSVPVKKLAEYNCIILGGGLFASGVKGLNWLKNNLSALGGKHLAVFGVGASPAESKAVEETRKHNMKGPLAEIPFFYLRGAWNEPGMGFVDRKLCSALKKEVEKKPAAELEGWEHALLEAYRTGGVADWKSREQLLPIIEWCKKE